MKYIAFLSELRRYERMPGGEKISRRDLYQCLYERTSTTSFDTHNFYQDIWAFRKIQHNSLLEIDFCDATPKNKNGKIMRRVHKSHNLGTDAGETSTLEI
jgi:hypothetical protein